MSQDQYINSLELLAREFTEEYDPRYLAQLCYSLTQQVIELSERVAALESTVDNLSFEHRDH